MEAGFVAKDPLLLPFADILKRRQMIIRETETRLTGGRLPLRDFASGHLYFGLHPLEDGWVFREWAPNATAIHLIGQMTDWRISPDYKLKRVDSAGIWELRMPKDAVFHGILYHLHVSWADGHGDRIPSYARRVVQDPQTLIFNAQAWYPQPPYEWRNEGPSGIGPDQPLLIYEAHVGMAQEKEGIGTFQEFTRHVLPRIATAGYNTLQLMAVPEHPYYGSFGYQVSSFFAPSSRFGTPEELKHLIDTAHGLGLRVVIDLIHSHAVSNEVEGLSRFDGTLHQYFHSGPRGVHSAWKSRCFDYGKPEVLHFLLSNCRFWLDEYRVDGFRFDGVTSMLYRDHGLGRAFMSYDDYFNDNVDEDALAYLALANHLIHDVAPQAITIAEDVSGLPGLAAPAREGGIGFDYRFAMGIPDYWIKLTKEIPDEDWPMGHIWFELTNRRPDERTISYAESHDQALVGDQTLIFRLIGAHMYAHMHRADPDPIVDRGLAIHKMIRLITLATAGSGYLNFMGNEFGHPEWIDFPRVGNQWSYTHARRQWRLADDPQLKYPFLKWFDRDMISLVKTTGLLREPQLDLLREHGGDKVIIFGRGSLILAFNFHPTTSHADYRFDAPPGIYRMILDSDAAVYGGHARLKPAMIHHSLPLPSSEDADSAHARHQLSLYLPNRCGLVLEKLAEEAESGAC